MDPKALLGDLDAHWSKDSKTWRGVIRRNRLPDLNPSGALSPDFCARHGAAVTPCFNIRCIWSTYLETKKTL